MIELRTRTMTDGSLELAVYADGEYYGIINQDASEDGLYHSCRACQRFDKAPGFETYDAAAEHVMEYARFNVA